MSQSRFRPCRSAGAARWVSERFRSTVGTIGRVVPGGFESYVRVLHPFETSDGTAVSWGDVTSLLGVRLGPVTDCRELEELLKQRLSEPGLSEQERQRLDLSPPHGGEIPFHVLADLAEVFRRHTETPQECYFAIWEGHGGLQHPVQGWGAMFTTPSRRWHLYTAPLEAAADGFSDSSGIFPESTDLWWPADRRWFVGTDIDIQCTYIGCDAAAAHDLQQHPQLETVEVNWNDDKLAA